MKLRLPIYFYLFGSSIVYISPFDTFLSFCVSYLLSACLSFFFFFFSFELRYPLQENILTVHTIHSFSRALEGLSSVHTWSTYKL